MNKYGVKFSTLKFWQDRGKQFRYYSGDAPIQSLAKCYLRDWQTLPAREIGHIVIQLSAVNALGYIGVQDGWDKNGFAVYLQLQRELTATKAVR